eukprot:Rhum_TRINITY_DN13112_c0_g1::Rhum_TRINITY_DN13112_c0_g1_i1::g.57186::m.57186
MHSFAANLLRVLGQPCCKLGLVLRDTVRLAASTLPGHLVRGHHGVGGVNQMHRQQPHPPHPALAQLHRLHSHLQVAREHHAAACPHPGITQVPPHRVGGRRRILLRPPKLEAHRRRVLLREAAHRRRNDVLLGQPHRLPGLVALPHGRAVRDDDVTDLEGDLQQTGILCRGRQRVAGLAAQLLLRRVLPRAAPCALRLRDLPALCIRRHHRRVHAVQQRQLQVLVRRAAVRPPVGHRHLRRSVQALDGRQLRRHRLPRQQLDALRLCLLRHAVRRASRVVGGRVPVLVRARRVGARVQQHPQHLRVPAVGRAVQRRRRAAGRPVRLVDVGAAVRHQPRRHLRVSRPARRVEQRRATLAVQVVHVGRRDKAPSRRAKHVERPVEGHLERVPRRRLPHLHGLRALPEPASRLQRRDGGRHRRAHVAVCGVDHALHSVAQLRVAEGEVLRLHSERRRVVLRAVRLPLLRHRRHTKQPRLPSRAGSRRRRRRRHVGRGGGVEGAHGHGVRRHELEAVRLRLGRRRARVADGEEERAHRLQRRPQRLVQRRAAVGGTHVGHVRDVRLRVRHGDAALGVDGKRRGQAHAPLLAAQAPRRVDQHRQPRVVARRQRRLQRGADLLRQQPLLEPDLRRHLLHRHKPSCVHDELWADLLVEGRTLGHAAAVVGGVDGGAGAPVARQLHRTLARNQRGLQRRSVADAGGGDERRIVRDDGLEQLGLGDGLVAVEQATLLAHTALLQTHHTHQPVLVREVVRDGGHRRRLRDAHQVRDAGAQELNRDLHPSSCGCCCEKGRGVECPGVMSMRADNEVQIL